jgi:hypothetical protein
MVLSELKTDVEIVISDNSRNLFVAEIDGMKDLTILFQKITNIIQTAIRNRNEDIR